MKHMILPLALVVGLAACASTSGTGETAAGAEKKTKRECTYDKSTGSRLGDRVCRTVEIE